MFKYANHVKQDSLEKFSYKKNYFYNLSFEGRVMKKVYNENAKINKFVLNIAVDKIEKWPKLEDCSFNPYYEFYGDLFNSQKGDLFLQISVPNYIFEVVNIGSNLKKEKNSTVLIIDNKNYNFLSKSDKKWFGNSY